MASIQELAQIAYDALETRKRDNGDSFICIRDGSPSWIQDVIHAGHGDMFPDDYKYEFARDAFEAIAEERDEEEAIDSDLEVYNSALAEWLASSVERYGYVDEAAETYSWSNLFDALQNGQRAERREVYDAVYRALEELATDDETEDAEETETANA